MHLQKLLSPGHGESRSSASGLTCRLRSTVRGGTKEGVAAEQAGCCITLRWHCSMWRRDGGGVSWFVGAGGTH